jgi:hypothetical protein
MVSTGIWLSCWKHWSRVNCWSQVRIGQDIAYPLASIINPDAATTVTPIILLETAFLIFISF